MAIIKHVAHKGSDFFRAVEYYTQIHTVNPKTGKHEPVLDAYGMRQERPNCRTKYINAHGREATLDSWAEDCYRTNRFYGKNNTRGEVKTHEFIISFRVEDSDVITWEIMESLAVGYIRRFCSGHQAIYSLHWDVAHPHIHITINSVRAVGVKVRIGCCEILKPERFWVARLPPAASIQWIKSRHNINIARAGREVVRVSEFLERLESQTGHDYSDLCYLLKQLAFVKANLQTETDKIDKLLQRWQGYRDTALDAKTRQWHKGYVQWCGCNADSESEFVELSAEYETAQVQLEMVSELQSILESTSGQWKSVNEIDKTLNNLNWQKLESSRLKQQLRSVRANRKKLWEIVTNCERAAKRRAYHFTSNAHLIHQIFGAWPQGWEKYGEYYEKYTRACEKERRLQKLIKESKEVTKTPGRTKEEYRTER